MLGWSCVGCGTSTFVDQPHETAEAKAAAAAAAEAKQKVQKLKPLGPFSEPFEFIHHIQLEARNFLLRTVTGRTLKAGQDRNAYGKPPLEYLVISREK